MNYVNGNDIVGKVKVRELSLKKYEKAINALKSIAKVSDSEDGCYYKNVEKNYDLMKKYFLAAINKGHSYAMYNLGNYYKDVEKDYGVMKKYYLMAIDLGNSSAMYNLAVYYKNVEKDYYLMMKYYLMAADNGIPNAINTLIKYRKNKNDDYSYCIFV